MIDLFDLLIKHHTQGGTQPCIFKVDKPGVQVNRLFCLPNLSANSLQPITVHIIGDFYSFLSALTSNNAFIIKLAEMWLGGTPDVAVEILKIRLLFFFFFEHNCTPSGKKTLTGVQVITASQAQSIGCR